MKTKPTGLYGFADIDHSWFEWTIRISATRWRLLLPSAALFLSILCLFSNSGHAAPRISPASARDIAKQAYIYASPMVENYNSIYQFAIDRNGDQYKGPINTINNVPRVFGPEDTGVVTPNSDTPYSFLIMDLRAEPLVVTLPAIERDRYYSLQLVDLYGHNVDYLGTREDGNGGGSFLIAGPGWKGTVPTGIKRVVHIDTELMFSQFRTQLKDAGDLDNVKRIQAGYKIEPLSAFAGTPSPGSASTITFPPISRDRIDLNFFAYVNFLLQFCPTYAEERTLRDQFRKIGVGSGSPWPPKLPAPVLKAIEQGRQDGVNAVQDTALKTTSSLHLFGSHEAMRGKYLDRAVGAKLGLYGNTANEALYPAYQVNQDGQPLDSGKHNYRLRFPKGQLPPVNAFWSLTMYDGKTKLLIGNPLNRYLINAAMVPQLRRDADGGLTLYLQHDSPGAEDQANWLPAPDGPMYVVLRLYLPKAGVLSGEWKAPKLEEVRRDSSTATAAVE